MPETQTLKKIVVNYEPDLATSHMIHNFLEEALKSGKEGECAYHLIGASLQTMFPHIKISDAPYNRAADNVEKPGDFFVGDTVFYVNTAPFIRIFEQYRQTLENGYRVYLLVPEKVLDAARLNAELMVPGLIAVESIETFIGQNIEELSNFRRDKLKNGFRRLLETYNDRINAAETDKSMLIEIPRNL